MILERLLVICTSAFISFKYLNHEKHTGFLLFHAAIFVATSLKTVKWQKTLSSLKFRPLSDSGIELGCFLIPMVITAQLRFTLNESKVSRELWTSYLLSCQLMSMTTACLSLVANKFNSVGTFMAFTMVTSCLGVTFNAIWGGESLPWYFYLLLAYLQLLYLIIKLLPQSFTLGEAMIISQGLTLVCTDALMTTHHKLQFIIPQHFNGPADSAKMFMRGDITSVLQAFVVGSALIGFMLCPVYYYLKLIGDGLELLCGYFIFYCVIGLSAMAVLIPMLYVGLGGVNPIFWVVQFITSKYIRMYLVIYWFVLVLVALCIVAWFYFMSSNHMILVRKYFHLLAVGIFVPGIIYDPSLTHLAASGAAIIFFILEYIRVGGIAPFGNLLQSSMSSFVDSRDSGKLILTHIYLLVGCAVPLWLYPESFYALHKVSSGHYLSLYSGVLSLGIGDTMASVVGTKFGQHHWPDSPKTVEGTIGSVLSQLLGICVLVYSGFFTVKAVMWISVVISIILASLLEAWTSQIDNVVLPLFLYSLLNTLCS